MGSAATGPYAAARCRGVQEPWSHPANFSPPSGRRRHTQVMGQAHRALGAATRDPAMRHLCGDVLRARRACLLVGAAPAGATPNFACVEASGAIVDHRSALDFGQRGLNRAEHGGDHVAEPRPIELVTLHHRTSRNATPTRHSKETCEPPPLLATSADGRLASISRAPRVPFTGVDERRHLRSTLQHGTRYRRGRNPYATDATNWDALQGRITELRVPATGRRNRRGAARATVEAPDATQQRYATTTTRTDSREKGRYRTNACWTQLPANSIREPGRAPFGSPRLGRSKAAHPPCVPRTRSNRP